MEIKNDWMSGEEERINHCLQGEVQLFTADRRLCAAAGTSSAGVGWRPEPLHCCGGGLHGCGFCGVRYSRHQNNTPSLLLSCCRGPSHRSPCTCMISSQYLKVRDTEACVIPADAHSPVALKWLKVVFIWCDTLCHLRILLTRTDTHKGMQSFLWTIRMIAHMPTLLSM